MFNNKKEVNVLRSNKGKKVTSQDMVTWQMNRH